MKKLVGLLLVSLFALTCTVGQCTHVHDENCGYDPETGDGCTHQCEVLEPLVERDPYI